MKKRKGREPTLFDMLDAVILKFIAEKKKVNITEIRNKTGLTHANLVTHMKRLTFSNLIKKEREKQTIYVLLSEKGKRLYKIFFEPYLLV